MRSVDDLYDLFVRFMGSIETDMKMIRESHQATGSEIEAVKHELRRHQSDVFKRIDEIEARLPKIMEQR